MNAKSVALAITFAAVAITLNVVRIPTFYYPGTSYQLVQIPIVVAFLLFGVRIGVLVGVLSVAGWLILFPLGALGFLVYPMDLVSSLIMFAGLFVANKFMVRSGSGSVSVWKSSVVGLTAFAVVFRGGIMPIIDYGVVYHVLVPLVLGITVPEAAIVGLVPSFILYNVTVPLFTIPIAYVVAKKVARYLKIQPSLLD